MRIAASVLATCALLALPAAAAAGPCTSEIDGLSKALAVNDAGSAATAGAGATSAGQLPPTATMNRETTGMAPSGSENEIRKNEDPPTATMNRATQGDAATPQDVQQQNRSEPSAVAATATEDPKTDIAQSHTMAGAMAAVERARLLDQQGQETECLNAVGQAKLIIGATLD